MSVVVYVHCTKGKHFAPKFNEFFRCKKQISSNQWVLFLEPFFSRQWKSLRVIHPTLGSRIFLPTHLRMVSAGGGGRKCSVNWPWKFSLAYAFGAPNVLVLFLWKNVFFWRWTTQDSKGQVKILLQKTRDFLFPLFLIFFCDWIRFSLNSIFFWPPIFFFRRQCIQEFYQFWGCGKNTEVVAIVVCIVTEVSQEGISCHDRWGCPNETVGCWGVMDGMDYCAWKDRVLKQGAS